MFKIHSTVLQDVVAQIIRAARRSRLSSNPIFVNACKKTQRITFALTGEFLSVEKFVSANVTDDLKFATTVDEIQLKVAALPEAELEFSEEGQNIAIKWGRNSGVLLFTVDEQYSPIQIPDVEHSITIPTKKWHDITQKFAPFTSLSESQVAKQFPITNGVHFSKGENGTIVQSTNRARAIKSVEQMEWFSTPIAIPRDTIMAIDELISYEETITVSLTKSTNIIVKGDNVVVFAQVLEGDFINVVYSNDDAKVVWRVDRLELLSTTRRIKMLGKNVPIMNVVKNQSKHFAILEGVLTEQISAVVETENADGFRVNALNLEVALTVLKSEEVLLAFNGGESPITMFSDDGEDDNVKVMIGQLKRT